MLICPPCCLLRHQQFMKTCFDRMWLGSFSIKRINELRLKHMERLGFWPLGTAYDVEIPVSSYVTRLLISPEVVLPSHQFVSRYQQLQHPSER